MDDRLKVTETPRKGVFEGLADMPLISIVWRILHEEHRSRAKEARRLQDTLLRIAEETYRLRRSAEKIPTTPGAAESKRHEQLSAIADRLEKALARLGLTLHSPEGESFTADLMELFENVSPMEDREACEPRVAEVLSPAVTYRGGILQMGKAVVAVPIRRNRDTEAASDKEETEVSPEGSPDTQE